MMARGARSVGLGVATAIGRVLWLPNVAASTARRWHAGPVVALARPSSAAPSSTQIRQQIGTAPGPSPRKRSRYDLDRLTGQALVHYRRSGRAGNADQVACRAHNSWHSGVHSACPGSVQTEQADWSTHRRGVAAKAAVRGANPANIWTLTAKGPYSTPSSV